MQTKTIFVLLGLLIFVPSTYMVFQLLQHPSPQLPDETYFRFKFLLGLHIYIIVSLLILWRLDDFFQGMMFSFFFFLAMFLTIFIANYVAHVKFKPEDPDELIVNPKTKTQMEDFYSDVYYLFYMHSIMGIAICGMFILVSQGFTCWPTEPVNRFQGVLEQADYQSNMQDQGCAICLTDFSKGCRYTRITKCGHIFHEDCLREWIRYNKICPLDRRSLLQP